MKIRKLLTATVAATALTAGMAAPAQAQAEGSLAVPEQTAHFFESIPVWITGALATPFILGSMGSLDMAGICIFPDSPHLCE